MIDVEGLKVQIEERWGNTPATELSKQILDFLAATPPDELHLLTFSTLANAAGRASVDEDVIAAVNILAASAFAVLQAKAMFVDEDANEYELDMADLEEAHESGELLHPETGRLVRDYERYVVPFFEPNARFLEA